MATKRRRPAMKNPEEEEWNSHKMALKELYFNKNLSELMTFMEREHDFIASKNQYERKFKDWGFRKNLTCEEWKLVLATANRRKEIRKESQMTLNGVLVPKSKVKKEEMRYALSELNNIFAAYRNNSLPDGICVFTPPPTPGALEISKNIMFHNLPSFVLMDLLSISGGFHSTLTRQPTSSKTTWSPLVIPGDPEESTIPSSSLNAPLSNESQSMVSESILPGLFNHSISRTQSEKKDLILREVETFMLERSEGEIADRTNKMLNSSDPENFAQFTAFVSNLSSNNMIEDIGQQKAFLEWVRQESQSFIRMMFSIKTPAMQACLEALLNYTVTTNDSATFELLFKADISKQWYSERREMLLLAAVRFDLVDVVRVIIDEGTDVNCQLSLTPWAPGPKSPLGAAATKDMALILLDSGADVKSDGDMLVSKAIERGQIELAELLLKAGAFYDPMQRTIRLPHPKYRGTQLAHAIYEGHTAAACLLLKTGAVCIDGALCYSDQHHSWATELQLAAYSGSTEMVIAILNTPSGRACISRGKYRWAPLRDACMQGHVKIVELLIAAGADVNAGKKIHVNDFYESSNVTDPTTPLMAAIEGGHTEVIGVLLRESVNSNGLDFSKNGTSALEAAYKLQPFGTVPLMLLGSGARRQPKRQRTHQNIEMCFAARTLDIERVLALVFEGVDVGYILDAVPARPDGHTCSKILRLFLEVCSDEINTLGPSTRRPALQIAMEAKQFEIARTLIRAGASLFTPWSSEGGCPLNCAIENREFVMIDDLVSRGANITQSFSSSNLDILFIETQSLGLINSLIEKGVNLPLAEWYRGVLPRLLATNDLSFASTLLLIENGAEVNPETYDQGTPLQNAAGANASFSIIKLLVERGANINTEPCGPFGKTSLQAAIVPWSLHRSCGQAPNMETIQFLLEKGADINAPPSSRHGVTALQGAAIRGYLKIAHMLLERGADPNAAGSQQGRTALEVAAMNGRLDMVQLLLNAGAHATEYAVCVAEWNNHFVIANLIKENIKEEHAEKEIVEVNEES